MTRTTHHDWTFVAQPTSIHTPCQACRKIGKQMFYKSVKHPSGAYHITHAYCGACFFRKDNERLGAPARRAK